MCFIEVFVNLRYLALGGEKTFVEVLMLLLSYAPLQERGPYRQAAGGAQLYTLSRVSSEELSAKRLDEVPCPVATRTQAPPPSPRSREARERVNDRAPLERNKVC